MSMPAGGDWETLAAGDFHTCGIREESGDRRLYCWGANWSNQLGLGEGNDAETPEVVGGEVDWVDIAAGEDHACGVREDGGAGTLWCWGADWGGQLGLGFSGEQDVPTQVEAGTALESGWLSVSLGQYHSCGVRDEGGLGRAYCWGANWSGQVGDGTRESRGAVTPVLAGSMPPGAGVLLVAAGNDLTFAIDGAGQLHSWGDNSFGVLGDGSAWREVPTPVAGP